MASPPPLEVRLWRLAAKYQRLAALRRRREEVERCGGLDFAPAEAHARRRALQRLAREFPGCLPELRHSSARELAAKAAAVAEELDRLRADGGPAPRRPWVAVVLDYHDLLHETLEIKAWISRHLGHRAITAEDLRAFRDWSGRTDVDRELLERHQRPPAGHLSALVWERLARRHGLPDDELHRAVFGDNR